jgi:hypothetical protein
VKILIPNGVDYALISQQDASALEGLSILILKEADISYIPLRVWQARQPRVVLWNSPSLSPVADWQSLDLSSRISIVSDGEDIFAATAE